MSNSLDPDQARHSVGPDLDSNCLQRLSAEGKICDWGVKSYEHAPVLKHFCIPQNDKTESTWQSIRTEWYVPHRFRYAKIYIVKL